MAYHSLPVQNSQGVCLLGNCKESANAQQTTRGRKMAREFPRTIAKLSPCMGCCPSNCGEISDDCGGTSVAQMSA